MAARVNSTYDMFHNYMRKHNESGKLVFRYNI